ncbi:MAG: hypothetical protein K0S54_942, partial [Alphaproteobacteria bacterium]|nr:hypothetical protein [Alphaproteobacteria bacterium]
MPWLPFLGLRPQRIGLAARFLRLLAGFGQFGLGFLPRGFQRTALLLQPLGLHLALDLGLRDLAHLLVGLALGLAVALALRPFGVAPGLLRLSRQLRILLSPHLFGGFLRGFLFGAL